VRISKKRERDQEIKLLLEQVLGKDYDKKKDKDRESRISSAPRDLYDDMTPR
jgi:hypothetical protein